MGVQMTQNRRFGVVTHPGAEKRAKDSFLLTAVRSVDIRRETVEGGSPVFLSVGGRRC